MTSSRPDKTRFLHNNVTEKLPKLQNAIASSLTFIIVLQMVTNDLYWTNFNLLLNLHTVLIDEYVCMKQFIYYTLTMKLHNNKLCHFIHLR